MPRAADKRLAWFRTFYNALLACFANLGMTDDDIEAVLNDLNAYDYTLVLQAASRKFYKACTKFRSAAIGSKESLLVSDFPLFVMPPNKPVAVKAGIMYRTMGLVQRIKVNSFCTETLATSLGIIGSDLVVDYATMKPTVTLKIKGGFIFLKFIRHYADGLIVECKRGDETEFTYLTTMVSKTTFTDKRPNLIPDKAETRAYRAWYMLDDVMIGLESDIFTIAIVGK